MLFLDEVNVFWQEIKKKNIAVEVLHHIIYPQMHILEWILIIFFHIDFYIDFRH